MLGEPLALGSSLTGGISDFLGGTTSRRIGTIQFTLGTQVVGMMLAGAWVAISGHALPSPASVVAAVGAGLGLMVGLSAFFQAMVVGTISIVAPISATGAAVPILAGIIQGERPSALQALGIVTAIVGVVLSTRQPRERAAPPAAPPRPAPTLAVPDSAAAPLAPPRAVPASRESGLGLALLAALGCGLFFWLMAPASRGGVAWALMIARTIPTCSLAGIIVVRRMSIRPTLEWGTARIVLISAPLAFCSIALYGLATLHGQLAIVSVLASLYPIVTMFLAYHVLGERVQLGQKVGIAVVLAAVVLMSAP